VHPGTRDQGVIYALPLHVNLHLTDHRQHPSSEHRLKLCGGHP
jgi:hypothetical protein